MRITAGEFRGRVLKAPKGVSTRPTASRLREALFNIAAGRIEGAALLDLFAGSGMVGFEALSRGASSVVFVEEDRKALQVIEENAKLLRVEEQVKLYGRDVFKVLKLFSEESFSLIYADPPYGKGLGALVAEEVAERGLLMPGGWLLIEESAFVKAPEGLVLVDERSYGSSSLTILSK